MEIDISLARINRHPKVEDIKALDAPTRLGTEAFQVPLRLRTEDGDEFLLPIDPVVSVSSKYNIAKRNVQKQGAMRGTIKEYWNQGDYSVSIAGVLIAEDELELEEEMRHLRQICDKPYAIYVECDILNNVFEIMRIVVEQVDFPFTKGINNQQFTIKALSDESQSLFA